jgi:hypothetical protein
MKTGLVISFDEADEFFASQLALVHVDSIGIHPWGGRQSQEGMERTLEYIQSPEYKKFAEIIRSSGKTIEFEAHAHSWLIPKDLFEQKPVWFRENAEGRRSPDFNMCVSNKEALSYLADRAASLAKLLQPDTDTYCWWTDDVRSDCFCHCDRCRELSPSDQYMIWCNTVLSGIRSVNPKALLCYIAYMGTMAPPQKIKPADGIFLEYAPIYRDSFIPIDSQECEKNRGETKHLKALLECFGVRNSRVLEYWLDNSRFCEWKKPYRKLQFDPEIIRRDVAFYRSLQFETLTNFACWIGTDYQKEYCPPDFKAFTDSLA